MFYSLFLSDYGVEFSERIVFVEATGANNTLLMLILVYQTEQDLLFL